MGRWSGIDGKGEEVIISEDKRGIFSSEIGRVNP